MDGVVFRGAERRRDDDRFRRRFFAAAFFFAAFAFFRFFAFFFFFGFFGFDRFAFFVDEGRAGEGHVEHFVRFHRGPFRRGQEIDRWFRRGRECGADDQHQADDRAHGDQ